MALQKGYLRSSGNKEFDHIVHLKDELTQLSAYLPRYATIDGELYSHELNFTELTSAVKTKNRVHPLLTVVQYWIFDVDYEDENGAPYEKRYELLVNAFKRFTEEKGGNPEHLNLVEAKPAKDHAEVMAAHKEYVQIGYEGVMIKKISNGAPFGSKITRIVSIPMGKVAISSSTKNSKTRRQR